MNSCKICLGQLLQYRDDSRLITLYPVGTQHWPDNQCKEAPAQLGKSDQYHCSMLMIFGAYRPGVAIIDLPMPNEPVWGPQRALYIAKNHPELTIQSADNYEWYANVCKSSREPVNSYFTFRGRRLARSHRHGSSADVTPPASLGSLLVAEMQADISQSARRTGSYTWVQGSSRGATLKNSHPVVCPFFMIRAASSEKRNSVVRWRHLYNHCGQDWSTYWLD